MTKLERKRALRIAGACAAGLLALAACQTAPSTRAAQVDSARIAAADSRPGDWATIGRTYDESFYSPLTQVNESNVKDLGLAWYADLDTFRGVESSPLVIDGVMYLVSAWDVTRAFDAVTGKLLWTYDPKVPPEWGRYACCEPVSRGIAAWEGKIIVSTLDGRLIALDAAKGTPVWTVNTYKDKWPYASTGAPRVFDGKVLIGAGGADLGVRGFVAAFDADDGRELWRFYTVPGDPSKGFESAAMEMAAKTWSGQWWTLGGGGSVWDAITYDPDLNLVYVGTGNGSPLSFHYRSEGKGDNLFLASIVALDADTGEYRWHVQTAPSDNWDYTATAPMILADLEIEGLPRKVLMQAPKNGFFYVIDRETGKVISAEKLTVNTWADHVDLETGKPVIYPTSFPDSKTSVLIAPGPAGAHNWWPMSYDPDTGLVYLQVMVQPFVYSLDPNFTPRPFRPNAGNMGFASDPHQRQELQGEAAKMEAAWLQAWDPVHQKSVWKVEYPRPGSGGVLSTAGNLVFQGTVHQTLAAYKADTGEKLWDAPAQTMPIAAPVTYEIGGVQYVALAAGWGGGMGAVERARDPARAQARLLVFKLGGKAQLPPFDPETKPLAPPPAVTATEAQIARGRDVFAQNCAICHGAEARGSNERDLRKAQPEVHKTFDRIVLGGERLDKGMPKFDGVLSKDEVAAVHDYIIARANEDWGMDAQ